MDSTGDEEVSLPMPVPHLRWYVMAQVLLYRDLLWQAQRDTSGLILPAEIWERHILPCCSALSLLMLSGTNSVFRRLITAIVTETRRREATPDQKLKPSFRIRYPWSLLAGLRWFLTTEQTFCERMVQQGIIRHASLFALLFEWHRPREEFGYEVLVKCLVSDVPSRDLVHCYARLLRLVKEKTSAHQIAEFMTVGLPDTLTGNPVEYVLNVALPALRCIADIMALMVPDSPFIPQTIAEACGCTAFPHMMIAEDNDQNYAFGYRLYLRAGVYLRDAFPDDILHSNDDGIDDGHVPRLLLRHVKEEICPSAPDEQQEQCLAILHEIARRMPRDPFHNLDMDRWVRMLVQSYRAAGATLPSEWDVLKSTTDNATVDYLIACLRNGLLPLNGQALLSLVNQIPHATDRRLSRASLAAVLEEHFKHVDPTALLS